MAYTIPPSNTTNIVEMVQYVNTVADGWFGIIVYVSVLVLCMISFQKFKINTMFAASTFISAVMALFLFGMSILPDRVMYLAIFAAAAGAFSTLYGN